MKKSILICGIAFCCFASFTFGQKIMQNQVPSVVLNNFQQTYPKAKDISWKISGHLYKVSFETGLEDKDHQLWYNQLGKSMKHIEDIAVSELPTHIRTKLTTDFAYYRIDDAEKISEEQRITYLLELKSNSEEWKVTFDQQGNVLSKIAD